MAGVNVKWTDGVQFLANDEHGHVVVTDRDGQGFKPPDLLLVSLVGCAGIDVVEILKKKRQNFTAIEATVVKENALDPPWTIEKIRVDWTVRGHDLKEKAVEDSIRLAEEKYCSVWASLKSEMITHVHVLDANQKEEE